MQFSSQLYIDYICDLNRRLTSADQEHSNDLCQSSSSFDWKKGLRRQFPKAYTHFFFGLLANVLPRYRDNGSEIPLR